MRYLSILTCLVFFFGCTAAQPTQADSDWPQFRGADGTGAVPDAKTVTKLDYSCYQDMAEPMLQRMIADTAEQEDAELQAIVYHGTGLMLPGMVSVVIHVACAHRVAAFAACRHLIETIKADLPVWKREYYADGSDAWLKGS